MVDLDYQSSIPRSAAEGASGTRKLTILHFNDVYNIEPADREPVGGAARLCYKIKEYREAGLNPLVLFSGDALNPSMMSTITLGKQMVPVLNEMGVACACVGNHDFDFGVEHLVNIMGETNFPWLMANVLDAKTGVPFAKAGTTWLKEWNGIKVGVVGLVEEEWLDTLRTVQPEEVRYVDFVEVGRRLAKELIAQGAELLVALTHMREPNDRRLAHEAPEFHLILGGHDHHYVVDRLPLHGNLMVKSGTDFRDMTAITVEIEPGSIVPVTSHERLTMVAAVPQDPTVAAVVDEYLKLMGDSMEEVLVDSLVDLDGRFKIVRSQESNLGNFVCDVWRKTVGVDVVILNSGTLRSDVVHEAGPMKFKDLLAMLPMPDETVVLECTGEQIVQALENGVSAYPKLEGRFPQVSGIRFAFNPNSPPMHRIVPGSVHIVTYQNQPPEPLEFEHTYRVGTKEFLRMGKDGFNVFSGCKVLVDSESGLVLPTILRNHFRVLDVLARWDQTTIRSAAVSRWKTSMSLKKTPSVPAQLSGLDKAVHGEFGLGVYQMTSSKWAIAPAVDGRITCVGAGGGAAAGGAAAANGAPNGAAVAQPQTVPVVDHVCQCSIC